MLTPEEKKSLLDELNKKKELIKELRSKLNEINEQKEQWFQQRNNASQEIKKLIGQLKEAKTTRDGFTTTVKGSKVSRDDLNKKIKVKVDELKKYEKEGNYSEVLNLNAEFFSKLEEIFGTSNIKVKLY